MIDLLLNGLVFVFVYMSTWYVISIILRRNDVADLAWGLGFVGLAWFMYSRNSGELSLLMAILISVWGVRLANHIFGRLRRTSEDFRYAQWRKNWGDWFYLRSYLQIFIAQGLLMWLVSMCVMVMANNGVQTIGWWTGFGIAVWLMGFWFESTADRQLSEFLKKPENKGKLMQSGLWSYSRHPNYFGEISMWWGLWLLALPYPLLILALVSPVTITFFISKVSGVPLLEKKYAGRADWEEYKEKTSVLIPWYRREK
jgi:steroid 5-alpha reductase family enzyme